MKTLRSAFVRVILPSLVLFGLTVDSQAQSAYASPATFTTFAGLASGPGFADGSGSAARFDRPSNLAIDASGNIYVADTNNNTIRKISSAGVVTTLAGTAGSAGSVDGTGAAARFSAPTGVTVDASGNVYVADTGNSTIRMITAAGVVTTLAGTAGHTGSADGTGAAASFTSPFAVAVDASSNVFVADTYNHTIRAITSGGVVTTLAGAANLAGSVDATGSAARFYFPTGIVADGSGNLYVADSYNQTLRKITAGGVVTTLAGSTGSVGSTDATGSAARFNFPLSVTVDAAGNSYVADTSNNTIRKITSAGVVTTLAGTAGTTGATDATGSAARFYGPAGVAVDATGNVFVSDTSNDTIRKITSAGVVTTFASIAIYGSADGTGTGAHFTFPVGTAVDAAGNVYVADAGNSTIRKITSAGVVSTFAGLAGSAGSADGTGSAARFDHAADVAIDNSGNVYVADSGNNTIRKITPAGVVTTLAGSAGNAGSVDGAGSAARFNYPSGVALDAAGNVYVGDSGNATIRKVTPAGGVTTLAGTAGAPGSVDGTGSAARFSYPAGVAVDGAGNVYVAEVSNCTIRKVTSVGVVTTLAGLAANPGSIDGAGTAARFNAPADVAVDGLGNLYVTDTNNDVIRKVTPAGIVSTVGGLVGTVGVTDGTGSAARFDHPRGVCVTASGNLYVGDTYNNTIRYGIVNSGSHDFNADGKADIILENTVTGTRGFWLMNGTAVSSWVGLAGLATEWRIAGAADFNGDGKPDVILENTVTGTRGFWLLNGTAVSSWVGLAGLPLEWRIAGAADFNGDGKPDLILENTVTGMRGFWLMNGTTVSSWVGLSTVATEWRIAGAADFNGDGKPDLILENTATGTRGFWLMNGTTVSSWVGLAGLPTEWRIAGAADFSGDGMPDLVLENTVTGMRGFWLMNGTTVSSWVGLSTVATEWRIAP